VMLVGDCAKQDNCLNGGGISYSLATGRSAGLVGARALKKGDTSEDQLKQYQLEWEKGLGKQQKRSYYIKEALLPFSDDEFDGIARRISKMGGLGAMSLFAVFVHVFIRRPSMFWKLYKFLS